jgi:DNA segregation ATPase FtsK/SpoIIIE-like protein
MSEPYDRWIADHQAIYDCVVNFAAGRKQVWASIVQRHVRVGYATARLALDAMHDRGLIGEADAKGKHDVHGRPGLEACHG